ncbi:MAG: cupin domain-containing protein [Chloroflexi bacterium]|nr:cupin domain-containing protein [Chloroflexota bacterium]
MPTHSTTASHESTVTAPDGIAIHTFATPAGLFVGVAEGRVPPGTYGIHRHLSLEQYTYVVSGQVVAVTADVDHPEGTRVELGPGALLLTSPGESLQFINEGDETARVLFICAPPYPPDDADTRTLAEHGLLGEAEIKAAVERLEVIRASFNAAIDMRVATLVGYVG